MSLYQNNWYNFTDYTPASASGNLCVMVHKVPPHITKILHSQNSQFFSSTNIIVFFLVFIKSYNNFIVFFFLLMSYSRFFLAIPFVFSLCILEVTQRKVKLCKGCLLLDIFIYTYICKWPGEYFPLLLIFFPSLKWIKLQQKSYIPSA